MNTVCGLAGMALLVSTAVLVAQAPPRRGRDQRRGGSDELVAASIERMMQFDTDQDGKLTKAEVADQRLASLFDRGDADHDGVLTKEELTALFKREAALLQSGGPAFGGPPQRFGGPGRRGPDDGGPDSRRPGGPGGGGPGGRGGFGPPGGFPRPGEVLPRFVQDELQLTRRQRAQLEKLQADVDARLAKILTDEQRERLSELRDRGPGGPADRGPGGPPPGSPDEGRPPREE